MDIDAHITSLFKLYTGLRSPEQDKRLDEKIHTSCHLELLKFLSENMSQSNLEEKSFDELTTLLQEDKELHFRAWRRLYHHVNALYVVAVTKHEVH